MKTFNIQPISNNIQSDLKRKIDFKTKPLGALGRLEDVAMQIGLIQNTLSPSLNNPHIIIFAGDHGIVEEGVSAYPQEVTFQMVLNFLGGGAGINVFCNQNGIKIKIVDAGVNYNFQNGLDIINNKIGMGTKNFLKEPAMSLKDIDSCFDKGALIINQVYQNGCNVIGFGEMGIGNTSSASALMSVICNLPVEKSVGRGTGLNDEALQHKIEIIERAIANHEKSNDVLKTLATFGGYEIAQMVGAMLTAAEYRMIILVDGFISTAAFIVAYKINPAIKDFAIFCHKSDEQGHSNMLNYLKVKPLLDLNMRLGEGTGAAIAYSVVQSAIAFLNEMASFESAGVSNKESTVNA